MYVLVF
jgi:hypothetical protein